MPGRFSASQDGIATGTSRKTLLEVGAPADARICVFRWWVHFDGTTATASPVLVQLVRDTVSITGTAITPRPWHAGSPSTSSSTVEHTSTGEGAGTQWTFISYRVPPTSGFTEEFSLGREIEVLPSEFLRIIVTAPATVNAVAGLAWEE